MTEGRISQLRQRNFRHFAANAQEAYIRAADPTTVYRPARDGLLREGNWNDGLD
jgi:hypothetical protein